MLRRTPLIMFLLALQSPSVSCQNYWPGYPSCAVSSLDYFAPQACYVSTNLYAISLCVCQDASFLNAVAIAIYNSCQCAGLISSAQLFTDTCGNDNITPALSAAQIVAAGDGGQSICKDPTTTSTTASASPSATAGTGSGNGNGSGAGSGNGNGNSGSNNGNTYNYGKSAAYHTAAPPGVIQGGTVWLAVACAVWLAH